MLHESAAEPHPDDGAEAVLAGLDPESPTGDLDGRPTAEFSYTLLIALTAGTWLGVAGTLASLGLWGALALGRLESAPALLSVGVGAFFAPAFLAWGGWRTARLVHEEGPVPARRAALAYALAASLLLATIAAGLALHGPVAPTLVLSIGGLMAGHGVIVAMSMGIPRS